MDFASVKSLRNGKSARLVPAFEELQLILADAFELAAEGEKYIFPELRRHTNLGKVGGDIVERSKVARWKNFWNSLRASTETDLMDEFGLRRACMWSGNSAKTTMENYALIRKEHYDDRGARKSYAKSYATPDGNQRNQAEGQTKKPANSIVHGVLVGDTGLEPVTSTL